MGRARRRPAGHKSGQALAEFAIVSTLLILLVAGLIDFGLLYSDRLAIANAARVGARWATQHPTAWDAGATPASNSIEGEVQLAGNTRAIPNDDSHIAISYYAVTGSTTAICGSYSQASAAFVARTAYSQSTCVKAGSLVTVTITYAYPVLTPTISSMFGSSITVKSTAAMLEQV